MATMRIELEFDPDRYPLTVGELAEFVQFAQASGLSPSDEVNFHIDPDKRAIKGLYFYTNISHLRGDEGG